MKSQEKTTTTATAYGKTLSTPLPYTFSWTEYETDEELVAAKDELTLEEQRKARNNSRMANARSKSLQKALDDAKIEKPTIENDDQLRLKTVYNGFMSSKKYTEEQARKLAADMLGVEWAE